VFPHSLKEITCSDEDIFLLKTLRHPVDYVSAIVRKVWGFGSETLTMTGVMSSITVIT